MLWSREETLPIRLGPSLQMGIFERSRACLPSGKLGEC
jgi:hypothetical protein